MEWESIRKLTKHPFFFQENEAKSRVRKVMDDMGLRRMFKTKQDEQNGKMLLRRHNDCHYPDNVIIAHFKRLGVSIALTCDRIFREVCKKEGIYSIYYPIAEEIL